MSTFEALELEAAVSGTAYRAARARADEASLALVRAQCRATIRHELDGVGMMTVVQCLSERGHDGVHVNLKHPVVPLARA